VVALVSAFATKRLLTIAGEVCLCRLLAKSSRAAVRCFIIHSTNNPSRKQDASLIGHQQRFQHLRRFVEKSSIN
jgi:hypothetical protein